MTTPIEPLLFSGAGGFALGCVTGYAIKKILKIVAVIVGLIVAAMAYLSWKNIITVNNEQLTSLTTQTMHQVNSTVANIVNQTVEHTANGITMGAGVVGIAGFIPGFLIGLKKG